MAQISVLERRCSRCGACAEACPFGAIELQGGLPKLNAACRLCGLCLRACPEGALMRLEARARIEDKAAWRGVLVYAEQHGGQLHPVSLELIGKARAMGQAVGAVLVGEGVETPARELLHYGVERVYRYDDAELSYFRADAFADCVEDAIRREKPSVVLVGATALGRSLAPRLATRFRSGLTADCTELFMRENGDLVQIRPAFGGNIMAQIVTPHTRPQFATVRYRVMEMPARSERPIGEMLSLPLPRLASLARFVCARAVPKAANISRADALVVGGRGLKRAADLAMLRELAELLGAEWAISRPLAERGWSDNLRQIGLSGRTVRPKLLIAAGVSGAVQFRAGMDRAEHIIAINEDPAAPIFDVAHVQVVGDLYEIVPALIARLREERAV